MLPSLFLSHGSPLLAFDAIAEAEYLRLAARLPRPRAILMMSPHWQTKHLAVGELQRHDDLIYDFYSFPEPLYHLQYPAPAAEFLLPQLGALLNTSLAVEHRGLDHGVWIPLRAMYPLADVPILQLSLPEDLDELALFQLGQQLAPLRQQQVLLIGGGTLTHNLMALRAADRSPWGAAARAFDESLAAVLQQQDLDALLSWRDLPGAELSHPSNEHLRPLFFAAGAAGWQQTEFVMSGFEMQLFSRRSVLFS